MQKRDWLDSKICRSCLFLQLLLVQIWVSCGSGYGSSFLRIRILSFTFRIWIQADVIKTSDFVRFPLKLQKFSFNLRLFYCMIKLRFQALTQSLCSWEKSVNYFNLFKAEIRRSRSGTSKADPDPPEPYFRSCVFRIRIKKYIHILRKKASKISSVADPGWIPDLNFFHPGSGVKKIPDPRSGSASKSSSIFNPDPDLDCFPIPDPGVKKALDPGSISVTRKIFSYSSRISWNYFYCKFFRFPCGVALWLCIRAGDCEKADLSPQQVHRGSAQG